jgi:hypothetical protein
MPYTRFESQLNNTSRRGTAQMANGAILIKTQPPPQN